MQADVDAAPTPRPRRRRLRAHDVRQKMLEAGLAWVRETGVGVCLEDVGMEDVIVRADVPRASVYRIWTSKSDFAADLLVYLAGPGGYLGGRQVFDPATFDVARKTMADHDHLLDSDEGRRAVLCEVVRRAVDSNFKRMLEEQSWRLHLAMLATIDSIDNSEARTSVATALEEGEAQARQSIVDLVKEIMAIIGLRLRDPRATVEHLVIAGVSLLQNLAIRHALTADTVSPALMSQNNAFALSGDLISQPLPGPAGIDGEPVNWTLPALAYLSLVDAFAEPDPAFRRPR